MRRGNENNKSAETDKRGVTDRPSTDSTPWQSSH